MSLAVTGPEGFRSNSEAIYELLRFGPSILKTAEFIVLLFHAERSTVFGRGSDRHSQRNALEGIYRTDLGRWVRGPCGVSKSSWIRANKSLIARGFLNRYRDHLPRHHCATEYEIVWPAIAKAIADWKTTRCEELGLFHLETLERRGA